MLIWWHGNLTPLITEMLSASFRPSLVPIDHLMSEENMFRKSRRQWTTTANDGKYSHYLLGSVQHFSIFFSLLQHTYMLNFGLLGFRPHWTYGLYLQKPEFAYHQDEAIDNSHYWFFTNQIFKTFPPLQPMLHFRPHGSGLHLFKCESTYQKNAQ